MEPAAIQARIALAQEIARLEALLARVGSVERIVEVPHVCKVCKTATGKETGR